MNWGLWLVTPLFAAIRQEGQVLPLECDWALSSSLKNPLLDGMDRQSKTKLFWKCRHCLIQERSGVRRGRFELPTLLLSARGSTAKSDSSYSFRFNEMARPGGLELPTFWFVAIRVKLLNVLFGVAYGLETPFFPQLAAPNVAPKTELYRNLYRTLHEFNPKRKSRVRLGRRDFEPPTSWSRTMGTMKLRSRSA